MLPKFWKRQLRKCPMTQTWLRCWRTHMLLLMTRPALSGQLHC